MNTKYITSIILLVLIVGAAIHVYRNSFSYDPDPFTVVDLKIAADNLVGKTIHFGHQSVGDNIMEGTRDLHLSFLQVHDFYIGENKNPLSKIADFGKSVNTEADIVAMKFCYVDITANGTPVREIFDAYVKMVDQLQSDHPDLTIVHMTVPLTSVPIKISTMVKYAVKTMLGRPRYSYINNTARETLNTLIRDKYRNDHLFDLAWYESNRGDYFEGNAPALYPPYTDDGGHLNEIGRVTIAAEFVKFLSTL